MTPAALSKALLEHGNMGLMERAYLHRATRERGAAEIKGREDIAADVIADIAWISERSVSVEVDLAAFTISGSRNGDPVSHRRHHWVQREGERIAHETIVSDDKRVFHPTIEHRPLGELSAGRGQLGLAPLQNHGPIVAKLDALWNGSQLNLIDTLYALDAAWLGQQHAGGDVAALKDWLASFFDRYPLRHFIVECVIETDGVLAVLWRCSAQGRDGVRMRFIMSSIFVLRDGKIACENTLIDRPL
jgi:ketosteroid isomerase-like protein